MSVNANTALQGPIVHENSFAAEEYFMTPGRSHIGVPTRPNAQCTEENAGRRAPGFTSSVRQCPAPSGSSEFHSPVVKNPPSNLRSNARAHT